MSNLNDKGDTFKFRPGSEHNKPQVDRREYDEYSAARRSRDYETREERSNGLIYLAIFLTVVLIIAIVAGIFILKPKEETEPNIPDNENITSALDGEEDKKEETPPKEEEKKDIVLSCSMVFYADSVIKKGEGYTVSADLYDEDFYKFDSRKLTINDETDIRESGKRLSADALIYLIENMGGNGIVFDGEIREDDGMVLSLKFDGSFREDEEEETPSQDENTPPSEDNTSQDTQTPPQDTEVTAPPETQNPPAEQNTESAAPAAGQTGDGAISQ